MDDPIRIPLPLPHIGSVNAWLLRGDPLTLIDTGPCDDAALTALEAGLRRAGVRARGHRARAGHAPSPRPQRARGDDRRALGRADRRLRARGRLRRALRRARRGRPALLARADAPPRRARSRDRRHRGVLGVHLRRESDPYARRRRAGRRRDASAPAAATCASSPGPGHSTTDALFVDERERIAFVGDHLLAKISSNTEIYPALEPDRHAPARARRVPARACGGRPRCRSRRLHTGHGDDITDHAELVRAAAGRPRPPLRPHRRGARAAAAPARSRSPTTCGPRRPSPSSPCSSSGRCSGTSTCCSTPDASSEHVTEDGSTYGVASFALAGTPTTPPRRWTVLHEPAETRSIQATATASTSPAASPSSPAARAGSGSRSPGGSRRRAPRSSSSAARPTPATRSPPRCAPRAPSATAHACHVGHWEELDALVEDVYRDFGRVDVLVNNAGVSPHLRQAQRRQRGALRQGHRRQPQGPVPARGAGRRADGRGRRRLDHQRLEHRRRAPDARHRPLRGGEGRRQRDDRRARARLRAAACASTRSCPARS